MKNLIEAASSGIGMVSRVMSFVLNRDGVNQSHLNILRDCLDKMEDLVPLNYEEMGLLSMKCSEKKVKKSSKKIVIGTFYSIYHEKLINYAVLKYRKKRMLILTRTSDTEIYYGSTGDDWLIYSNELLLGLLDVKGIMFGSKRRKNRLARMDVSNSVAYQEIYYKERLVASLNNPYVVNSDPMRVFHLFNFKNLEERKYMLALSTLNLILRKKEKIFKFF